jgi:DNA-directed RNA polymerase beta subunit
MYNGETGERVNSMIFIGPTMYSKLKHLACEKIHCVIDA